MNRKMLALLLAVLTVFSMFAFASCANTTEDNKDADTKDTADNSDSKKGVAKEDFKIGFICLHDENSTYDNNFIEAAKAAQEALGLTDDQVVIRTNVPEGEECYNAAAELADAGCNIVFADSFGHETYMIQAAEEFPDVQFCHATGTHSRQEKLDNFHNAFASIYEGRYLAGIAAGMKLNEMIAEGKIKAEEAKIGYVGAFPYAEVKSGYTSFFLGARSVCETATMDVTYTNSWFDIGLEREAALKLINDGCVLISQHADSEGAPKACEEKGVPNVAYNISTISMGPNTALISSKIDWQPYFELIINAVLKGEKIPTDWCGTIATGSVVLTELNETVAAKGTKEAIAEAQAKLEAGELKVFDTSTFTVDGKNLTEYLADVDGDFTGETNVIVDGEFKESGDEFRSAPYFDIIIDGVNAAE